MLSSRSFQAAGVAIAKNVRTGERALLLKRIVNRLGRPYGINPFPRAFENPLVEEADGRSGIFERIFVTNYWGCGESHSGVGSSALFTERYRQALAELLSERNLKRIFDAPCGDMNWMSTFLAENTFEYAGGDISPSVVAAANRRFPGADVRVFDICTDAFPPADVWHCRDCLFHLPFADIEQAFQNFLEAGIPYALLTTHRARLLHRNLDVNAGGFRYLDLERPPISLPAALCYLPDYHQGREFPRFVGLWRREAIAAALDIKRER